MAGNSSYSNRPRDPQAGVPSTKPPAASPSYPVPQQWRSENLYPLNNPNQAMLNVLMKMGFNPLMGNPFVNKLLDAAPGLAAVWQLSNLGANANDMTGLGGPEQMFGDFLKSEIQGGNVISSLRNGMSNMGNYASQMSNLANGIMNGGVPIENIPPFLAQLSSQLNSPGGFANIYGSMAAPLLGSLDRSYNRALQTAAAGAGQRYYENADLGNPNAPSFFETILGRR